VQVVDQVLLPVETPASIPGSTLLDTLKESGGAPDEDSSDFDLLVTALQATGLDAAADDPDADLTVFAPTDAAFVSLAQDLGYAGADEAGALQTILDASAAADPDDPLALVQDILTYHISPGAKEAAAVLSSDTLETLNGAQISVAGTALVDQDPDAAEAEIVETDLVAANGIAHVIDEVLLPLDLAAANAMAEDEDPPDSDDDDGFDFPFELLGVSALVLLVLGQGLA